MAYELTNLIKVIFQRASIERILSFEEGKRLIYDDFDLTYLQDLMLTYNSQFSDTEVHLQLQEVQEQMSSIKSAHAFYLDKNHRLNVFSLLFVAVSEFLTFSENRIVCKYNKILEWNLLIKSIGEELPVMAMIAKRDVDCGRDYVSFAMMTPIGHNNTQLKRMLDQGMAENHFHLRGSSPYFAISWINMMNSPFYDSFSENFRRIERNIRDKHKKTEIGIHKMPLEEMAICAAFIRLYLCSRLSGVMLEFQPYKIETKKLIQYLEEEIVEAKSWWERREKEDSWWGDIAVNERTTKKLIEYLEIRADFYVYYPKLFHFLSIFKNMDDVLIGDDLGQIIRQLSELKKFLNLRDCRECLPIDLFQCIWQEKTWNSLKRLIQEPFRWYTVASRIQIMIDQLKNYHEYLDYMLEYTPKHCMHGEEDNMILAGERWFLYSVLKKVILKKFKREEINLFYAYLRIKNEIQFEFIQNNHLIGFENFQIHQARKDMFSHLNDFVVSEKLLARLAVRNVLNASPVKCLEARISMLSRAEDYLEYIKEYDDAVMTKRSADEQFDDILKQIFAGNINGTPAWDLKKGDIRNKFYYVVEFSKRKDEDLSDIRLEYRHYNHRARIKKQAEAFLHFRREYPEYGRRILGIGASSQEIGCRPEVFATAFRMLIHDPVEVLTVGQRNFLPQLKITYHVGEDFLDIVDGLRAIDEAIRFLNMECGDRLGHALALGVDAAEWYGLKKCSITLTLQDYLDNIVWLHHALIKYKAQDGSALIGWLEEQYSYIFSYIYQKSIPEGEKEKENLGVYEKKYKLSLFQGNFDINTYYLSWLLRGDNPEWYKTGQLKLMKNQSERDRMEKDFIDPWEMYSLNKDYIYKDDIRCIPEVAFLYYLYHYNYDVRKRGNEITTVTVHPKYIEGVKFIQKAIQNEIVKRGISIETNPSSNIAIGTMNAFSKHPIKVFYNKGLTKNEKELMECPQIHVSINTDDKEVFSTKLDNEYALLACALEQEKGSDNEYRYKKEFIYEWLDHIRKMGLSQSFIDNRNAVDVED